MTLASFFERYLVMIAKKNFIGLLLICVILRPAYIFRKREKIRNVVLLGFH